MTIFFVALSAVTCVPLKIPPRALLLNGSCGYMYGSSCVFGCQSGYVKADGNVTRTCLQTGQWSGNPIYCIGTQRAFINENIWWNRQLLHISLLPKYTTYWSGSSYVTELFEFITDQVTIFMRFFLNLFFFLIWFILASLLLMFALCWSIHLILFHIMGIKN